MRKIKIISNITTVMDTVVLILFLLFTVAAVGLIAAAACFTQDSLNHLETIDPDSIVAGYEVIGTLMGSMLGGIGTIVLIIMAVVSQIGTLYFLVPVINAIMSSVKIKKLPMENTPFKNSLTIIKIYKKDGVIKSIINGIPAVLLLLVMVLNYENNVSEIIFPALFFTIITALSLYQVISLKNMYEQMNN